MNPVTGRSIPDAGFFDKYGVNVTDKDDIAWFPIVDHLAYPAAGALILNFFANGNGQGATSALNAAAGPKTFADTNLEGNGQLPVPERALVVGISVDVYPGLLPGRGGVALATAGQFWNDVWQIARSGFLLWNIGQKRISLDAPLIKYGSAGCLAGVDGITDSSVAAANTLAEIDYAYIASPVFSIVPVAIPSSQNFPLTLNWPALVPTPSGTIARIGVTLHGYRIRKAQ